MDTPVYDRPHHRAAALLEQFVRVPAEEAIDLVERVAEGRIEVRRVADVLKEWTR